MTVRSSSARTTAGVSAAALPDARGPSMRSHLGGQRVPGAPQAGDGAADGQTEIPASRNSRSGVRIGGRTGGLRTFLGVDGLTAPLRGFEKPLPSVRCALGVVPPFVPSGCCPGFSLVPSLQNLPGSTPQALLRAHPPSVWRPSVWRPSVRRPPGHLCLEPAGPRLSHTCPAVPPGKSAASHCPAASEPVRAGGTLI